MNRKNVIYCRNGWALLKLGEYLRFSLLVSCMVIFFKVHVSAHESRPLFIQIIETSPDYYKLKVTVPNSVAESNLPELVFPTAFVMIDSLRTIRKTASGYLETILFEPTKKSIKGQNIEIRFPKFNPSITSIVQVDLQDKTTQTLVISPQESQFFIPESPSSWTVVHQYTWLGMEHIWAGIDHLLFLVCLLVITGFSKKLFWTITGFTVAHSVTLVLSTLGWIQLAIKPVEACIALSIIFLCYEIIHQHSTKTSLTYRYPVLVSSSFGLLHGFGFASVLSEIGLPPTHLGKALLFFNIGVEIGQILFLGVVVLIQILVTKFVLKRFTNASNLAFRIVVYGVGILASFWFFERLF